MLWAPRLAQPLLPAVLLCPLLAFPAESVVPFSVGSARLEAGVKSMRALRDAGMVRQRLDYSCGSAALATLLTYGLGDAVDEERILREIMSPLSQDEVGALQKRGLSLLELQKFAEAHGYRAQGFRIPADQLARVSRPVIVFVKPGGYNHFAVLKGVQGNRVYLADPSQGNVRMLLYRFLDMWADETGRGVVFAVERADATWPVSSALQIGAAEAERVQELTTRQLLNIGAPFLDPLRSR